MHIALCLCLVFLDLYLLTTPGKVKGEDVVGCGGFVRSKFPVDFTRIQVRVKILYLVLCWRPRRSLDPPSVIDSRDCTGKRVWRV